MMPPSPVSHPSGPAAVPVPEPLHHITGTTGVSLLVGPSLVPPMSWADDRLCQLTASDIIRRSHDHPDVL